MASERQARVASLIHRQLADLMRFEVKDPRVARATLTDVEVTGDLREAKVFIAAPDDPADRDPIMRGLERASGFMRRQLGQRIQLRVTPSLQFRWDESIQYGARIDRALKELGLGEAQAEAEPDDGSET